MTPVTVSRLDADSARRRIDDLARVLHDCVEGGASVSFMWPFETGDARDYWTGVVEALKENRLHLYGAACDGVLCGTVQLWLDGPCNQRHRGDIRKLLVHRSARRVGVARALMGRAQADGQALGLSLLTLDAVTGSPAERLYHSLGWQHAGIVPRYAKWPDGRFCDASILYKELHALGSGEAVHNFVIPGEPRACAAREGEAKATPFTVNSSPGSPSRAPLRRARRG